MRGLVEGFYGRPWSHRARLDAIAFLAPHGMNAYVYAPKDDPKHRADWRVPYDTHEREEFAALAAHGDAHGVRFGFAISPGLDIDYASATDRRVLREKLVPLLDAGVSWTLVLLDDIPLAPGLAARQADLATWLLAEVRAVHRDAHLTLCPTEYVGTRPSPYLAELGRLLPRAVDVMWTGPTVCSPEIRAADARSWMQVLGDRRTLVWDNFPVNDATMSGSLHLGAYCGRDPALADAVGGILCNPMTQPYASMLPLATAMDFLTDPDGYDADASLARAVHELGGARAESLAVLARACADSPLAAPSRLPLAAAVDVLEAELGGPGWSRAATDLVTELRAARGLADVFPASDRGGEPGDDPLAAELAPWVDAARREAEAGLAALRLLQQIHPTAKVDNGRGAGAGVDAEAAMQAAFLVLFLWQAARADQKVVYGPRFAVYTPIVQLPDGRPALDVGLALREDANVIDRLCRFALTTYDRWRTGPDAAEPQR